MHVCVCIYIYICINQADLDYPPIAKCSWGEKWKISVTLPYVWNNQRIHHSWPKGIIAQNCPMFELLLGRGGNLFQPSTLQIMNSAKQFSMLITDSLVDNSSWKPHTIKKKTLKSWIPSWSFSPSQISNEWWLTILKHQTLGFILLSADNQAHYQSNY
jgi:hypothetical protein